MEAQKYGTLELAKIENMRTQDAVEEELEHAEALKASAHTVAAPEKKYCFLAVCAGEGLATVFKDLGADEVVSGGQTMNPSTESILAGVDKIPAETVFILPNNGNIIMAAQQCSALTEKHVVVIPTKTAVSYTHLNSAISLGEMLIVSAVAETASVLPFRS